MMICLNLYGGPGIGKSTLAAELFTELKHRGIRTELVGEYAKELVYEMAYNTMADQHYLFAEQAHRLWRLEKAGVEVAVCDSPLLLTLAYNRNADDNVFSKFVVDTYRGYMNLDYVLERNKHYWDMDKRKGDVQDAIQMDHKIDAILKDIWNKFPEKINVELVPAIDEIANAVEDILESQEYEEPETPVKFSDEPWKTA